MTSLVSIGHNLDSLVVFRRARLCRICVFSTWLFFLNCAPPLLVLLIIFLIFLVLFVFIFIFLVLFIFVFLLLVLIFVLVLILVFATSYNWWYWRFSGACFIIIFLFIFVDLLLTFGLLRRLLYRLNNLYWIIFAFARAFINKIFSVDFLSTTIHEGPLRSLVAISTLMRCLLFFALVVNHGHDFKEHHLSCTK